MGSFLGAGAVLGRINKWYLLAFLFLSTVLCSHLSVYIHPLSISISFETIPLLITGFLFGPIVGLVNAVLADIATFNWGGGFAYSFWFLLQPASIGFFGGIWYFLRGISVNKLGVMFVSMCTLFTVVYGCMFPSLIPILCIYLAVFLVLWDISRSDKNNLKVYLLFSFALVVYVSSFCFGVLGSISLNSLDPVFWFFKVRTYKEIVKLLCFFPTLVFILNQCYRYRLGGYGRSF